MIVGNHFYNFKFQTAEKSQDSPEGQELQPIETDPMFSSVTG
jgi:hypothetical protein